MNCLNQLMAKRIIFIMLFGLMFFPITAMSSELTQAQLGVLKSDILADPILSTQPLNSDGAFIIAAAYNIAAIPDFWVYRSSVTEEELTGTISIDGTSWSWTAYIGRTQGERDGWREMFSINGKINPSLPNIRSGMTDIFSGASGAAQRAHLISMARRKATRIEKLFSVGVGSISSLATMSFEGSISYQSIEQARNMP